MPRGVYILCCQGSSADKDSGLFSAFEFIETINLTAIPTPKEGEKFVVVRTTPFRVIACWMIEPDKGDRYEDEFEFEFRMLVPDAEPIPLMAGKFNFRATGPVPFHRMTVTFEGGPPFQKPGITRFESRVRKVGGDVWVSQDYPIHVNGPVPVESNGQPAKPTT